MVSDQLFEYYLSRISDLKERKQIEKEFYIGLSKCLEHAQFESFKKLIKMSIKFDIFIDAKNIPNRFKIISSLLLNCTERVSEGYQTSALGDIIDILRFCNEFRLLEKELTEKDKKSLGIIKQDDLFLSNLNDLFGNVSDSFIIYIYKVMPRDLYNYFMDNQVNYFPNLHRLMNYIKNVFFNQYTIYGLSIRYLSTSKKFVDDFTENYLFRTNHINEEPRYFYSKEEKFIEFNVVYNYKVFYYDTDEEHEHHEIKRHLVSPYNILKNKDKILAKNNYHFYILSMVLVGGLGPQGLGFTYSTPKGEVIEICSDQKETEAIIVNYKQFLKNQFLTKFERELSKLLISKNIKRNIINYLTEVLDQNILINYYNKELIIKEIKSYLYNIDEFQHYSEIKIQELIKKIARAISIILRKIKLKDQFITRMDLISQGKIKSNEVAKLTSLRGKSHYDVLRERFFFQYIIDWFYEIYFKETSKLSEIKK
ncbi:MAG: hypothetical protein ACFE9T_04325 [Promethearchaeota archaeon]